MRPSRFLMVMIVSLAALEMAVSSHAQTVTTLYSFTGTDSSGNPGLGALAQGRNGKLYGTTVGPSGADGSAFAITTSGHASQLYTFGSDGANPWAGLTLGADGYYYGTASTGGANGNGVLFKLSPTGDYSDLHDFAGGADGAKPFSPPIQASDSNFYGVTFGTGGASTVYRYEPDGTFTTIYNFDSAHGQQVLVPLIQGSDGNLYGVASFGGTSNCGTIFKLATSGAPLWTYNFPCALGGAYPEGPLVQGADGDYYGTTLQGGPGLECGIVFKLGQAGNVSVIYEFKNLADGCDSEAGLTQGTDGNLYGTTLAGGTAKGNQGTLFQLTTGGAHKILYSFGGVGEEPLAAPMQDTNGTFYGTTYAGGRFGYGTVYSLNMGLGPFVTFVQPTGAVGGGAQILGQGLTGATSVTFNGVPATSFTVVNDTYMTAVVPSGATTGKVVVTTPSGPLTSNVNFRILN